MEASRHASGLIVDPKTSPGAFAPGVAPLHVLQDVHTGVIIWERGPNGYSRIDFCSSPMIAQDAYPAAVRQGLPPRIIEEGP